MRVPCEIWPDFEVLGSRVDVFQVLLSRGPRLRSSCADQQPEKNNKNIETRGQFARKKGEPQEPPDRMAIQPSPLTYLEEFFTQEFMSRKGQVRGSLESLLFS